MPRVKRGKLRTQKRKKVLQRTKGFRWRRKNVHRLAKEASQRAMTNQYIGRKRRKRDKRQLWQIKINAAARQNGTTYSKLIHSLKQNNVELDRKMLADLAEHHPDEFKQITEKVKH